MKIKCKLHRINNLQTFAASFLKTGGKPTAGFDNWGTARVHLATDLPSGSFGSGFLPTMSLKTDANGAGEFSFTVADTFRGFRGQILAFDVTTVPAPLPGLPPIPLLAPVYRSQVFKFGDISAQEQNTVQKIFIFKANTETKRGISQSDLNAEITKLKKSLKLDRLRASILENRVSVQAEKSGGDVKFSAFVRGSTSSDLGRVIEVQAGEIDIDLPGPDFIVGLCVDKDEIEAQIRKGLSGLSKTVSGQLLAQLEKEAPGVGGLATVSVWRTRYVQTGTSEIAIPGAPRVQVPVRSVVPDAAFGVPKQLY